jgi:hypothetical protein
MAKKAHLAASWYRWRHGPKIAIPMGSRPLARVSVDEMTGGQIGLRGACQDCKKCRKSQELGIRQGQVPRRGSAAPACNDDDTVPEREITHLPPVGRTHSASGGIRTPQRSSKAAEVGELRSRFALTGEARPSLDVPSRCPCGRGRFPAQAILIARFGPSQNRALPRCGIVNLRLIPRCGAVALVESFVWQNSRL